MMRFISMQILDYFINSQRWIQENIVFIKVVVIIYFLFRPV